MNDEGWSFPFGARKCHYFVNRHSLCGKWVIFISLFLHDGSTDSRIAICKACSKKLQKLNEVAK